MKKFLKSTAVISVLAVMLTGCGERERSRVLDIYASTHNETQSAPAASAAAESGNAVSSVGTAHCVPDADPTSSAPMTVSTSSAEPSAPVDLTLDDVRAAYDALCAIVDSAMTVEELTERISYYNAEYPDYAVGSAEVTDRSGEPVTTGLLKNGMSVAFPNESGGSIEFMVIRAPKDIIPDSTSSAEPTAPVDLTLDDVRAAYDALCAIVDSAMTVEELTERISDYNAEYPDYAVGSAEVTDRSGEPVTAGLLKNGMSVTFPNESGGAVEFMVIRAPKDVIPDNN
ncbi:MAG: hypothetical protein NC299_05220 [Lachnospiraceae bacterium]|nr:hypothetical protein [Ruminococcus sp.]MCM1274752.1 hypothetical protein [Lachnospiraceae bacterium]